MSAYRAVSLMTISATTTKSIFFIHSSTRFRSAPVASTLRWKMVMLFRGNSAPPYEPVSRMSPMLAKGSALGFAPCAWFPLTSTGASPAAGLTHPDPWLYVMPAAAPLLHRFPVKAASV